ncbi:isoleucine--tRNA ligase [Candidatus Uhrbacteria bacterium CG10_big_fil_rev_8_21_14_0_10_48_11]|uniref:Isoleucine--tRNA ligase n=1 Tax=Candidatus Uhrbacteria bacterium CG10_big_fil_rev_8_21_14_0_10_48_11 TaxID=1975037 RepID=A0A2M8LDP0_9BACT|nr:MAG: isoleucine--tRNA ligase [Candidatus Uhrbacteria bacterium CG10_big_fil_rev_8_21_14_0_10_48_11]
MSKAQEEKEEKPRGLPEQEQDILHFWEKEKIFQRSVSERPAGKPFVFYDGPPYATGVPHIGTLLAQTQKDVVPRYKTMRGYRVERRFGWDCHGLPIEVMVEKALGLNSRKDIEAIGIKKFNTTCREMVLKYVDVWQAIVTRIGRWVDFENDYKTMDLDFMESGIWVFKQLYDKGLVYEAYRSSLYCTRCETPLSKMETGGENYREVTDPSVYVAFRSREDDHTFFLAWTTTPWTLSANTALAVNAAATYVKARLTGKREPWARRTLILAKDRLAALGDEPYEVVEECLGSDLVGKRYEPVQPFITPEKDERAWTVLAQDFVSLEDGTGIVHVAPAFGEDDFGVHQRDAVPLILTIGDDGRYLPSVTPYAGRHVKEADQSIITDLTEDGHIFSAGTVTHSYPFCWRCKEPLIYKVQDSIFVAVEKLKKTMFDTLTKTHWVPEHIKEGRFMKGIETAPDWNISRKRYWGIPVPIWKCDSCDAEEVLGSLDDIEAKTGNRPIDLHRPAIDTVTWPCSCGGSMQRVPDVCDVWFDSGSMPYGQAHYPFEHKEQFEKTFPAEFIAEGLDQTRGWFYTLHVLAAALFEKPAFKNVIVNGLIMAEDGTKMSKSKGNMPDSNEVLARYGADALRLYLMDSPLTRGESVNFSEQEVGEVMRKTLLPLSNVYSFFALYAPTSGTIEPMASPTHILDRWILARLEAVKQEVTEGMEHYELWRAAKPLASFINDLSTWYVRRSRDRFKGSDEKDKSDALSTLFTVLLETTKIIAPFAPFIAEAIYQKLKPLLVSALDSVHLELWPEVKASVSKATLLTEMESARKIIELGHALRAQEKIKVRQPLGAMRVQGASIPETLREVVLEELNVKTVAEKLPATRQVVSLGDEKEVTVSFDLTLTPELEREGLRREFVRQINALRKKQGLTIHDRVAIIFATESETLRALFAKEKEVILKDTLADDLVEGEGRDTLRVNSENAQVTLKKSR